MKNKPGLKLENPKLPPWNQRTNQECHQKLLAHADQEYAQKFPEFYPMIVQNQELAEKTTTVPKSAQKLVKPIKGR